MKADFTERWVDERQLAWVRGNSKPALWVEFVAEVILATVVFAVAWTILA